MGYKSQAKSQKETLVSNYPLPLHLHKPGNAENEELRAVYRCAATGDRRPLKPGSYRHSQQSREVNIIFSLLSLM